jgi:hypothetical protein
MKSADFSNLIVEINKAKEKIAGYEELIKPLRLLIYDKQKQLAELQKEFIYDSLISFVEEKSFELQDFIESKEKIGGCYFLYKEAELIYVGISIDINKRLKAHKRGYDKKDFDLIKYIPTTDYLIAIKLESYYINKYKPKFNISSGAYIEIAKNHNYYIIDEKINYITGWPDKSTGITKRSKRIKKNPMYWVKYTL